MRLTLRTLLAYLDNTLEPQDAAALRQKLSESGFATQLVQRIQGSLSESLPAPSPEAVGPVEDANVISEYLDSTLPTEQVAEIERACLESGPHLAEAAACHQILTMVLGKPAEVSEELRKRIYELPERDLNDIATAPSFSGLSIPVDRPSPLDIPPDEIATVAPTSTPVSEPVTPVGVNDSGVSDAPTRLREAEAVAAAMGRPERKAAIAGSKTQLNEQTIYGGVFRPSRVTPWLVSLGLVAALAFAMVRIFEPLWSDREVAEQSTTSILESGLDTESLESDGDGVASESADEESTSSEDASPDSSDDETDTDPSDASETDDVDSVSPPTPLVMSTPGTDSTEVTEAEDVTPDTPVEPVADEDVAGVPEEMDVDNADSVAPPIPAPTGDEEAMANDVESAAPPIPPPVEDLAPEEAPEVVLVGSLISESSLVAARVGDVWEHVKKDDDIPAGIRLFVAPTFRAEFATEKAALTFVGPSMAGWDASDPDQPVLEFDMGSVIIQSTGFDNQISFRLGSVPVSIRFADDQSAIAVSVQHYRAPGLDPLLTENRRLLAGAQVLKGSVEITWDGTEANLVTGQQWTKKGSADPQVTAIEAIPAWATSEDVDGLEKEAQEGLMALIEDAEPIEIELREARLFRRAEVGALAARTLLHMGLGDVYFGGDGILSDAKQRSYWLTHFNELQSVVNRSEESALNLRAAIVKMDSANALPLFRLLIGFSQTQLVEGGDEELVELLDSPSMAVRVLALENLEAITGTTLYFRPEQENAVRREPGIKKWTVRQRKGDIRWQE